MRVTRGVCLLTGVVLLSSCGNLGSITLTSPSSSSGPPAASGLATSPQTSANASGPPPRGLDVEVVTRGLDHGWDVGFLPDGKLLVTQLPAKVVLLTSGRAGASTRDVQMDLKDVMVQGEGGLLGMVVHPDFATSREFTVCLDHQENGRPVDIRLVTWRLSEDETQASKVKNLLTGLPIRDSGRHSGCRPTVAADGALIVGTGDTAQGGIPQDRTQLGGKTLRLDLKTGQPMPDNPFISSADPRERYVYTYGHRNVQGVALRPGSGQVFTAEHGPDVDDEVNLLKPGGNYGWDPAKGGTQGGYDESVPMTDTQRFPDAVPPVWASGDHTEATSGAAFLSGQQWGGWDGALVVAALKGSKLIVLTLDAAGRVTGVNVPQETNATYGRLRAPRLAPDGALYVTSSNGGDDVLLRITPKG